MLTQPVSSALAGKDRILLAGCGGGYDVYGAVPLYVALTDAGKEVHLANLSFCYLNGLAGARQEPLLPNLYEVPAQAATQDAYCPEAWLSRWLEHKLGRSAPVWSFEKTGVRPLRAVYEHLIERLDIDAVVLIDGGIDALLRGDETSLGTPAEDLCSLAAVTGLAAPVTRLLACVGLGIEMRDGICHAQVFERIAELTREGGYLGASALTGSTRAGALYADAVEFAFANQSQVRQSHIHRCVLGSMRGDFGSDGPHIWMSPLHDLYWYFDLATVTRTHLFLDALENTTNIWEISALVEGVRKSIAVKDRSSIPI